MKLTSLETVPEIGETVLTILSSGSLTLLGLGAEYNGVQNLVLLKRPESNGSGAEAVVDIFDGTFEGEFAELAVPTAAG